MQFMEFQCTCSCYGADRTTTGLFFCNIIYRRCLQSTRWWVSVLTSIWDRLSSRPVNKSTVMSNAMLMTPVSGLTHLLSGTEASVYHQTSRPWVNVRDYSSTDSWQYCFINEIIMQMRHSIRNGAGQVFYKDRSIYVSRRFKQCTAYYTDNGNRYSLLKMNIT